MADYLFQNWKDNKTHDISYTQIQQLFEDNLREEEEGRNITMSTHRGENFYDTYGNTGIALQEEYLHRDPMTAGTLIYYPHGIVIEQSQRRNYYRGENKIYEKSISSLLRELDQYSSQKEKELCRIVADMRIAEFSFLLRKFNHVQNWTCSDVLYEPLAQHYGLETGWLDITSDFNVALFFAVCDWNKDLKCWEPLTKEKIEKNENTKYGMIYHMPSSQMGLRWDTELSKFNSFSDRPEEIEGETIDKKIDYPVYKSAMKNLIYPIGFQPFMRCHMQNAYAIYMRTANSLQNDAKFEKLRFRHSEKLSKAVFDYMQGGELIYPHEGLSSLDDLIKQIASLTEFSEESFQEALYRNHYYRIKDAEQCKKDLSEFKMNGRPIQIKKQSAWSVSPEEIQDINSKYDGFSFSEYYGIQITSRQTTCFNNMFEPWMIPEENDGEGVKDFKIREDRINCISIRERNTMRMLYMIKRGKRTDF